MDWHELEKKKVTELRDMAKEQNLEGVSGLSKDQLVEMVAHGFGIERPHLVATGIDKTSIKRKIKSLKLEVQEALQAKDRTLVKQKRRQIHRLKRKIHRAAHLTH
jgi:hypothetical protein